MLRVLIWGVVALVIVAAAAVAYIRLAPSDPGRWHVDPLVVEKPAFPGHYLVRPEGGDTDGPVFDATPAELMAAFHEVAISAPRTTVLAGSVADGHVTYIQRSATIGFPDYVSVRVVEADGGGARLAIFSRLRFGQDDMGVNRDRVERWLEAVALPRREG